MNDLANDFLTELEWLIFHACARLEKATLAAVCEELQEERSVDVRTVRILLKRLEGHGIVKATVEPGPDGDDFLYTPNVSLEALLRQTLEGLRQAALRNDPEAIALFHKLSDEVLPGEG